MELNYFGSQLAGISAHIYVWILNKHEKDACLCIDYMWIDRAKMDPAAGRFARSFEIGILFILSFVGCMRACKTR